VIDREHGGAERVLNSELCWYRLVSTTPVIASRFVSTTARMPSREDSSRRSLMPPLLVLHQVRDRLDRPRLVDLIRHFGDDDALALVRLSVSTSTFARMRRIPRPVS